MPLDCKPLKLEVASLVAAAIRGSLAPVVAATALLAAPTSVFAQATSTQVIGQVVDRAGAGVGGARVTATHLPSGNRSSTVTDSEGNFDLSGLRIGGPFRIEVTKEGAPPATLDELYTKLGEVGSVVIDLQIGEALAEVVVAGRRDRGTSVGAGVELSSDDIVRLPTVSRDLKDFARVDPKAIVDPFNVDALEIAGTNNRYNAIYINGIRQGDDFGLNNNGWPTQRAPIPPEWVEGFSILAAPFDARYGEFRGGTVNIVTKSGDNDFHGSAYYYQNDDGLTGDRSKERALRFAFEEKTYGAWVSGPILEDRLFFFAGYDQLDAETPVEVGATGGPFAVGVPGVTQAEYDQILGIARTVYGFEPGEATTAIPETDEKILVKLDWTIADGQRLTFAYQKGDGNATVFGENNSVSLRRVAAPSNWYNREFPLEQLSLQLYSDWSDRFSTELALGRKEVTGRQDSLQGTDFAEMFIRTPSGGQVALGPDEFRHANALTNDLDQARLSARYRADRMTWSAGIEYEKVDIFNLFVARSEGQYQFNSIADFAARRAQSLAYSNAFTNNKNDGAAKFETGKYGLYLQNDWQLSDSFRLSLGARYDRYASDDAPRFNAAFQSRYGYSNQETLDGRDLFSPRLGFTWDALPTTTLRGGVGLFGGGTPNVWLSNSFSVDGVTVVSGPTITRGTAGTAPALLAALDNVDGNTIPTAVQQTLVPGNGTTNAIDPNFEIPSAWVYNLGVEHRFDLPYLGENWRVTGDVIYGRVRDEILYRDTRLAQIGVAPDGRPRYARVAGTPAGSDYILMNTDEGSRKIFSLSLEKTWRTAAGRFDLLLGYGYQDVDDVNSGTSSQASSNWDRVVTAQANDPELETSPYEIKHRFPLALTWEKPFFGDYRTSVGLFMERRTGRPFSYTFGAGTVESTTPARVAFGDPRQAARQRQLLYVPRDQSDVLLEGGLTWAQLDAFIDSSGLARYRGQIAPRNAFTSPWITVADLRLSQELPAFFKTARGIITLDIKNVANLINSDWGRVAQVSFPYVAPVLDARIDPDTNRYVYRPVAGQTGPVAATPTLEARASVWRMQLGVKFEF